MYPIRQVGASVTVAAATAAAATASPSHVLVSNTGSTAAWSDFAFNTASSVPATPLLPVPPGRSIIVAVPPGATYWCSSIGGVTVTPIEVKE